jgi:hypothetical protein
VVCLAAKRARSMLQSSTPHDQWTIVADLALPFVGEYSAACPIAGEATQRAQRVLVVSERWRELLLSGHLTSMSTAQSREPLEGQRIGSSAHGHWMPRTPVRVIQSRCYRQSGRGHPALPE